MKRFLILLPVLALIFMIMPATVKAQSKSDFNLDKLFEELKEMIEEELDNPDFNPEKLMENLKEKIDEELGKMGEMLKDKIKKLIEGYLGEKIEPKEEPKPEPKPNNKIDFILGIMASNTEDNSGVNIQRVVEGSPAEKAGIKVGDKITSFGKYVIRDMRSLQMAMMNFKAGMKVGIGIRRGSELLVITMTLEKRPAQSEEPKEEPGKPYLGLGVDQTATGVIVREVRADGPAANAGIMLNDIILSIAGKKIAKTADMIKVVSGLKPGQKVMFIVKRRNEEIKIVVTIGTVPKITPPEKKDETGEKPFLGIRAAERDGKVFVTEVIPGGSAEAAGVKINDQIYMLGRTLITNFTGLVNEIAKYKVGQSAVLIVVRDGVRKALRLTFKAMPTEPAKPLAKPYLGFRVEEKEDGVYINDVVDKSPASYAGFECGDRLHYFGEVKIKVIADIKTALERYHVGNEVGCVVYRGETRLIIDLKLVSKEDWEIQLKENPPKNPIWLGFSGVDGKEKSGVVVTKVAENGPADRAGIMVGDVIINMNETKITSKDDLKSVLNAVRLGNKVPFVIRRHNAEHTCYMTMMKQSVVEQLNPIVRRRAWIGISLKTTYKGEGIQINVDEKSAAEQIGLKEDDVITAINGVKIEGRMQFAEIWKNVKPGSIIKLAVLRGEEKIEFELPTFMQPNHEDTPMPDQPKVPEGWKLPQLPGGMTPEQYYAISNLSRLAIEAMQTADYDEAIKHLKKILEIDSNNFNAFYNLACIYSLQNEKEKGLEYLKLAIGTGFINWEHIKTDTDLDNLRDMPAYKEMMADKKSLLKLVADMKVKEIKAAYGEKFNFYVDIDNMLIISTEHPQDILEDVKNKLVKYAEAQWKTLFDHKPDYFITIIIPTPKTFDTIVQNRNVGGFYSHSTRSLIAKELGQTLVHEFTHALHYGDIQKNNFARQNIWFVEGLATCFENSYLKDGVPTPMHNGRLYHLQELLKRNVDLPKLADFMARDRNAYLGDAGISYTLSRYIAYWLWDQGLLKKYYDLYTEMLENDPNGIKALEKLLEKPIDEIEKDWYKWVRSLPDYKSFTMDNRPYIGIRPTEEGGGIKIVEVMPDTPAFKAGFQKGDVLTHIDGERVISLNDLFNILMAHKPADEIEITFVRDGEKKTIKLKLVTYPKEEEKEE